jgi:hypothetical protein
MMHFFARQNFALSFCVTLCLAEVTIMAFKKPKGTITTTIRMNVDLRYMLESIAGRENRSLSGQMIHFLSDACTRYMNERDLEYYADVHEVGTQEDYGDFLQAAEAQRTSDLLDMMPSEYAEKYSIIEDEEKDEEEFLDALT